MVKRLTGAVSIANAINSQEANNLIYLIETF